MIIRTTIYFHFTLLIINLISANAQSTDAHNLHLIARAEKDSIMLRWAPSDYQTWDLGNRYGYIIRRYTVFEDSVIIEDSHPRLLNSTPIKPKDLNKWEELVKRNEYAGVAAQALYGKSFEITTKGLNPSEVYYKQTEQNQRFGFALHAADMSVEVARYMGLYFTDSNVDSSERYFYKITLNVPDSLHLNVQPGFHYTGYSERRALPVPFDFKVNFQDGFARMKWNSFVHDKYYLAWEVQRKRGSSKFEHITEKPLINITRKNGKAPEYIYFNDSLSGSGKTHSYRVRGINAFGEHGPWSEVKSGTFKSGPTRLANITDFREDKKGINLMWEFPVEEEDKIEGFEIYRSDNHQFGFKKISKIIKSKKREYLDKTPLISAYYKVKTVVDSNRVMTSFPFLVQLSDSIPPSKPHNLTAVADTNGLVLLEWAENSEQDFNGYRVFRSMSGKDEYTLITPRNIIKNSFTDTLDKKNLNASAFYKIAAYDYRQNQSEFSAICEVIKHDKIAPSIPVFKDIHISESGIEVCWINSSCDDVKEYHLYREIVGKDTVINVSNIAHKKNSVITRYSDRDELKDRFRYKLMAVDEMGNTSDAVYSIEILSKAQKFSQLDIEFEYNLNETDGRLIIEWHPPVKNVSWYKIYRRHNDNLYGLYETLEGHIHEFKDYGLKLGHTYEYKMKVGYLDGSISQVIDMERITM